jgi:hypothetical protein
MLPVECNMPDLSRYRENRVTSPFILHQLIGADEGFPPEMSSYRRNMVRLADKAVREYMDAREHVLLQMAEMRRPAERMAREGRVLFMPTVSDRLEDCILTLRRLLRYYEKVRTHPSGFPLDRLLRRRIEALEASVREVRNLVEHLDDDISSGKVEQNQNTMPMLDAETKVISLAGFSLPIDVLAQAIERFYEFSHDFARYRLRADGEYEHVPSSGPLGPQT